jgi:hypothetical protein
VDCADELRGFNQRQRRPFGLPKGRATPRKLTASAAIKYQKGFCHRRHFSMSRIATTERDYLRVCGQREHEHGHLQHGMPTA